MHARRRDFAIAARIRRLLRGICAFLVLAAALVAAVTSARAEFKAIEIGKDLERLDILPLGEVQEPGDRVTVTTVPEKGGVTQSFTAEASTPGTRPGWFAFALHNPTDKQVERWLVVSGFTPIAALYILLMIAPHLPASG